MSLKTMFPPTREVSKDLWSTQQERSAKEFEESEVRDLDAKATQQSVLLDVLSKTAPGRNQNLDLAFLEGESFACTGAVYGTYSRRLDQVNVDIPNPRAAHMIDNDAYRALSDKYGACPNVYPALDMEFFRACRKVGQAYDLIWIDRCGTWNKTLEIAANDAFQCIKKDRYMVFAITACNHDNSGGRAAPRMYKMMTMFQTNHRNIVVLPIPEFLVLTHGNNFDTYIYVIRHKDADITETQDDALIYRLRAMFHKKYKNKFNSNKKDKIASWMTTVGKPTTMRSSKRLRGQALVPPTLESVKRIKTMVPAGFPHIMGREVRESGIYYLCRWNQVDVYWISVYDLTARYGEQAVDAVCDWDLEHEPDADAFDIEDILDKRASDGKYLVRFCGYPSAFDSYEDPKLLNNCEKFMNKF